jgi:hypothetical protein
VLELSVLSASLPSNNGPSLCGKAIRSYRNFSAIFYQVAVDSREGKKERKKIDTNVLAGEERVLTTAGEDIDIGNLLRRRRRYPSC